MFYRKAKRIKELEDQLTKDGHWYAEQVNHLADDYFKKVAKQRNDRGTSFRLEAWVTDDEGYKADWRGNIVRRKSEVLDSTDFNNLNDLVDKYSQGHGDIFMTDRAWEKYDSFLELDPRG